MVIGRGRIDLGQPHGFLVGANADHVAPEDRARQDEVRDDDDRDEGGEEIATATTSWLIIGTESRRLQRIEQHIGNDHPSVNLVNAIEKTCAKTYFTHGTKIIQKQGG